MYEGFFGLQRKPFELVPNPDFLYLSRSHTRAGTYLNYAMQERAGFILLTGEVGSGKTTLIRQLLKTLGPGVQVSKVFNTRLAAEQLVAIINDDFGLEIEGKDKVHLLKDLYRFLISLYGREERAVLIVDEAQNLSVDSLEELRMLSNLETNDSKLLQIILVGQPELRDILAIPEMRQLRQRISIHCHLQPLGPEEIEAYVLHRLEIAGNRDAAVFEMEAWEGIHMATGGIPRLINILCDFLLLSAFSEETRTITGTLVAEVAGDPQFEGQFRPVKLQSAGRPKSSPSAEKAASVARKEPERPTKSDESRTFRHAPEVQNLYRRLDTIEASIREVCHSIVTNEFRLERMKAGLDSQEEERELVLEMPDLQATDPGPGAGWLSGVKKLFLK